MRFRDLALLTGAAGAGMFAYGMLVESRRLVLEKHSLRLPLWPESLSGYKIAVLADFHLRGRYSLELAQRAVAMALHQKPDMVVLAGDLVAFWEPQSKEMIRAALEPLRLMDGKAVAVAGNHDYFYDEDAAMLGPILDDLNIQFLRNEVWVQDGISWVGIDSAVMQRHNPVGTMAEVETCPAVCLWHEADLVDELPQGCALQISGHSHGGQFRFPFGITPMHSYLGKKYPRGFYPDAPTPLYVSRGVGTTGPPSRFLCPPEVSLLTLMPVV
ncbi:MAG TPA: metallophosphoesterase [Fimbriimonas sp.]|nr:metallophosphoesterase [Fimbriimonas sp.]